MLCPKCGTDVGNVVRYCKSCSENKVKEEKSSKKSTPSEKDKAEAIALRETATPNESGFKEIIINSKPAGFWLRFFACLFDLVILSFLYFLLIEITLSRFQVFSLNKLILNSIDFINVRLLELGMIWVIIISGLISIVIKIAILSIALFMGTLLYNTFFESSKLKATPGKLFLGIYVTNNKFEQQSFVEALIRNALKILSNITLGIGYIISGVTEYKQSLHDLVSNSYIVRNKMSSKKRSYFAILSVIVFFSWFYLKTNYLSTENSEFRKIKKLSHIPKNSKISGNGKINGKLFYPTSVSISSQGILTFREGREVFADKEITIFLFEDFKNLNNKIFKVVGDKQFGNPHIHISEMTKNSKIPQTVSLTKNYFLILKFSKIKNNKISGEIELSAGGKKPASLNLEFIAHLR